LAHIQPENRQNIQKLVLGKKLQESMGKALVLKELSLKQSIIYGCIYFFTSYDPSVIIQLLICLPFKSQKVHYFVFP